MTWKKTAASREIAIQSAVFTEGLAAHLVGVPEQGMVVAYSGSRKKNPLRRIVVRRSLAFLAAKYSDLVVHVGDCWCGVDEYVQTACKEQNIRLKVFKADWKTHGKKAGPLRNGELLVGASMLIALPCSPSEGESRGTRDCMQQAQALGIPVFSRGPVVFRIPTVREQ